MIIIKNDIEFFVLRRGEVSPLLRENQEDFMKEVCIKLDLENV